VRQIVSRGQGKTSVQSHHIKINRKYSQSDADTNHSYKVYIPV